MLKVKLKVEILNFGEWLMKKFSIKISDETYKFINESAQKKDISMSEFCNSIIERYRDEAMSFEKNVLYELNSNTAIMQKILNKISDLEKSSNAQLIIQRMLGKESSKAGFLAKTRFEEFENSDERMRLLKKMDEYVDDIDVSFLKTLKKMDLV